MDINILNTNEESNLLEIGKHEQHENEEFLQLDAEALKAGDDELDDQIAIKDSENLDKEDNEFIVWANDAEDKDEEKLEDQTQVPMKEFGIELAKDTDELLVTWHGKEIRVPCKEEVSRDLRYHSRQLHLIAYPICFADLEDPVVNACLKKASNIVMEVNEAHDGPPSKGYLKMKLNTLGEVKDVRKALEELPPFPKQESEDTSTETGEPVKAEGEGGEKEHKEEEKPENVDEGADKKEEKSGEVAKEQEVVEKSNKRGISILIYTDHISENHVMAKIKGNVHQKDTMATRLLYVANIGLEITESELSEHFSGNERVIIPARDNKTKGYAYVQFSSHAKASEALAKFKETSYERTGWFAIEAIDQCKAEIGVLKDELRAYWLEQVRNLESTDRSSKSSKELSDLDKKLLRYKKRIITDNNKRLEFGFVIPESELYTIPEGVKDDTEEKEYNRDRSSHCKSSSRKRSRSKRSRSRRRRTPPRYNRRGRSNWSSGGSYFGNDAGRRSSQLRSNNDGVLVNQLQQLVGALSNFSSQGSNFQNYNNSAQYSTSSQYNTYSDNRSSMMDDRSRYGGYSQEPAISRDRFNSERKRRYEDYPSNIDDRYGGRYNNDYRGFRGSGY